MTIDGISPAIVTGGIDDAQGRIWLTCIHSALRDESSSARVLGSMNSPGAGWNYYSVLVGSPEGVRLRMLLNAAGRLVAAANDNSPAIGPLDFVDIPSPRSFEASGFVVATAEDLNAQLAEQHMTALSANERDDVDYHRPERVGDLVYNWFD